MLYMIGLGLGDHKDITVRGLEAVRSCTSVYLEHYTSLLISCDVPTLSSYYGVPITLADREFVESRASELLSAACNDDVAFLVVGDVFGATTHSDLYVRAREAGVTVRVIHNSSIMNAVGCTGLQLYRFGETVSLATWTKTWRPRSFYAKLAANKTRGLHTLVLLDIRVREPTPESLARGKKVYEPPRFMTVREAVEQLMEAEAEEKDGVCGPDALAVGIARCGSESQRIVFGTLEQLREVDFGAPLHSVVVCGEMHEMEREMLGYFKVDEADVAASKAARLARESAAASKELDDNDGD